MLPAVNSIDSSTALSTKITEIYPLIPLTNQICFVALVDDHHGRKKRIIIQGIILAENITIKIICNINIILCSAWILPGFSPWLEPLAWDEGALIVT